MNMNKLFLCFTKEKNDIWVNVIECLKKHAFIWWASYEILDTLTIYLINSFIYKMQILF